jgi:CRP-like cAMP-binding protein
MSTVHLEAIIDERPAVRKLLLRYAQVTSIQASETAFANAEHTVEARLARWLLMCHDRLDGNDIPITHEFLSIMLGVRRAGVTTATHVLEGNGLIRAKRGVITVLDRERMEGLADNSYGLPESEYERLIRGG